MQRVGPGLESPYEKADPARRLLAGGIDGSLVVVALYFASYAESPGFMLVGGLYAGLRDAFGGRSFGKFCAGLRVLRVETGRPCSVWDALKRNLVFVFPGVSFVAVVLETVTMIRDSRGYRLGDRVAGTQVVEGFGARDLVGSFRSLWPSPSSRLRRRPEVVKKGGGALFADVRSPPSRAAESRLGSTAIWSRHWASSDRSSRSDAHLSTANA